MMALDPLAAVFLAALVTALMTGLGAVPFALVPRVGRRWLGRANAVAAGLMLAASLGLVMEGAALDPWRTALGAVLGFVLIRLSRRLLDGGRHAHLDVLKGADAAKALLVVGIMTLHSFAEGVGVGVSFGGGEQLGLYITAAIALHNVPEGLAIALVLVPRGVAWWRAAGWAIFSSLPQPLMAVPAFAFVLVFAPLLPIGLGLAAGAMLWMCMAELIPEARLDIPAPSVALITLAALLLMLGLQIHVLDSR